MIVPRQASLGPPAAEVVKIRIISIRIYKDLTNQDAQDQGRVLLPNRMNFRKNSKRPSPPPLPTRHFRKIMLQFFMTDMVAFMRGGMMTR